MARREQRDELLTVRDVAERLVVNEETVRRYIRQGRLAVIRLGERPQAGFRIRASELEAFLRRQETGERGKLAA